MILADTGIWAGHFRQTDSTLVELLGRGMIAIHPFVIGELALGNLRDRAATLSHLALLPTVSGVSFDAVLTTIEKLQWMGRGIGWVDASLLAATLARDGTRLWSRDVRLAALATEAGVGIA